MSNVASSRHGAVHSALLVTYVGRDVCKPQRRKQDNSAYMLIAFRICSAFRNSSDEAILMKAGMILVNILANEMSVLHHSRHMEGYTERRQDQHQIISSNADGTNLRRVGERRGSFPNIGV